MPTDDKPKTLTEEKARFAALKKEIKAVKAKTKVLQAEEAVKETVHKEPDHYTDVLAELEEDAKLEIATRNLEPEQERMLALKVGTFILKGFSIKSISQHLKVSKDRVRQVMKSEEYQNFIEEVESTAKKSVHTYLRRHFMDMAPDLAGSLQSLVKKENVEAIKVTLKAIGILDNEQQQQDNNLTVIFGDAEGPTTIKTTGKKVSE